MSTAYHSIFLSAMQGKSDNGSEDEGESKRSNSAAKLNLQATAFVAMGLAWPESTSTQGIPYFISSRYRIYSGKIFEDKNLRG